MRRYFIIGLIIILALGTGFMGCDKKKRYYVSPETTQVVDNTQANDNSSKIAALEQLLADMGYKLGKLEEQLGTIAECCSTLSGLGSSVDGLNNSVANIDSRLSLLENNVGCIKKDESGDIVIEGRNLRVRDGSEGEVVPGVGNIIVGRDDVNRYTDFYEAPPIRDGSNNIIIGGSNEWRGSGGLCVGMLNKLIGENCGVFGCENEASGQFGTVTGGTLNKAKGKFSSVSGGLNRCTKGVYDWRAGGEFENQ